MAEFPEPLAGTVFYEDEKVYACLAFHPTVNGHTIVAWKENVEDLNDLNVVDFDYLMRIVYLVRRALMYVYDAPKVYVAYLDEAKHVHVTLFPRKEGDKKGYGFMNKPHGELAGSNFAPKIEALRSLIADYPQSNG